MGGGLHAIEPADLAVVIVDAGSRFDFQFIPLFPGRGRIAIAAAFLSGGVYEQPDHAFRRRPCLQLLHRAGSEMICAERAIHVESFQHHHFAFEIAQPVRLAVDTGGSEVRGGLANLRRGQRADATRQ